MSAGHWFRILQTVAGANFKHEISPYKLTLVVTKRCGSRCTHCRIWQVKDHSGELGLEEFEKLARSLPHLLWLDLTGGEPTDRDDLPEIAEAFIRNCPRLTLLHFPTNGLEPERVERQARALRERFKGRLVISVSLDGPSALHARLRGVRDGFARAVETYRRLREIEGVEVHFGMTLFEENKEAIEATVSELRGELGRFEHRDLHVNLGQVSAHYYENAQRERIAVGLDSVLRGFLRKRGFSWRPFALVEWLFLRLALRYTRTGRSPVPCESLRSSVFVSEKGEVYPCAIWSEKLGELKGSSLDQILRSPEASRARERILREECARCWTPCEAYPSLARRPVRNFLRAWTSV